MMTPKQLFAKREQVWETAKVGDYLDCKFIDDETAEVFLVESQKRPNDTLEQFIERCTVIANENFSDACLIGVIAQDVAEQFGYDTY